ncbi:MAG: hypothetical protein CMF48_07730 [Legionellales bacterium]|nr:hypothetical protein [Legionellales bacterium]|tara:strand:- start:160 stop:1236 length:1077 start_codon:yes stop_codon:yes gene_type:complete
MYEEWMKDCLDKGFGELHAKFDPKTGLRCLIAIHDTTAGPSLGGCRLRQYDSTSSAVEDVLRLARGMTLKSLMAGLPLGGGKSVIWVPEGKNWDRKALFEAFGDFVESLDGQYITAVDMGTNVEDMDVIAQRTSYVTCTSKVSVGPSDPSSLTALGVFCGMKAAVEAQLSKTSFEGLTVAVQGVGHVGLKLCKLLKDDGAKLIVCDANPEAVDFCANELGAQTSTLEDIYDAKAEIFSPCAVGGTLSEKTIKRLNATVVAGAANNQLATPKDAFRLQDKGIIVAPDYVINSGGIIHVAYQYQQASEEAIVQKVHEIFETTRTVLQRAKDEGLPPSEVADKIALERLSDLKKNKEASSE